MLDVLGANSLLNSQVEELAVAVSEQSSILYNRL
jgi:hypothetical protein